MSKRKKKGGPRKGVRGRRVNDRLKEEIGLAKTWCLRQEQWRHVIVCLDGCPVTRQRKCKRLQAVLFELGLSKECAPPRKRRRRNTQRTTREQTSDWMDAVR